MQQYKTIQYQTVNGGYDQVGINKAFLVDCPSCGAETGRKCAAGPFCVARARLARWVEMFDL